MQCFKLKTVNLSKLQFSANNDLETEAQIIQLNRSMKRTGQTKSKGISPAMKLRGQSAKRTVYGYPDLGKWRGGGGI